MVGQTRGPSRPGTAPPRSFQPISPPPSEAARSSTISQSESELTPESCYPVSNDASISEEEINDVPAGETSVPKSQGCSSFCSQKATDSKQTNVKLYNSDMTRYVTKKMGHISNSQILSILPSSKNVENVKQADKSDTCVGAKRNENQPNFVTMQQKINEKLLANQIPIQSLQEQQIILKQVNASDNIVAMTTAKLPSESNQNYFAMLTNKTQTNYLNYVSLPVNQQNFIAVDQQQKSNFVVMEAQSKANLVTVPQKSGVQSSGQTYLVHGNGTDLKQFNSYLAVTTKPGDTNGTTFFTMTPTKHNSGSQTTYLMTPKQTENSRTFVAVSQKGNEATYLALPAGKSNENNKTATFIAMEPNKSDTNIIVTQVLPSSQHFQLEYTEGEGNKGGKYFSSRDNAVVQSVVPKLSCSAVSSGSVLSTKTAVTNTLSSLSTVTSATLKKNGTTSKVLTSSSGSSSKTTVPSLTTSGNIYITTSANVTFLSSSNVQTLAGSNIATLLSNSSSEDSIMAESEDKVELKSGSKEESSSSSSLPSPNLTVPSNNVLNSNVPHSHQYLIPNMDNLKLAAENMNKIISSPSNPSTQTVHTKSGSSFKLQSDQNFHMHNYSKSDTITIISSKSNMQETLRKKTNQVENNKMPGKNIQKYSHVYSNYQRNDTSQSYSPGKSRLETRPTNHQRINDVKSTEQIKSYGSKMRSDFCKEEILEDIKPDIEIIEPKKKIDEDEDEEEEGVEVRPVFDMRIPLVFQVVLTDHSYGLPMLVVKEEKPTPFEEDKESVLSSDGKGEDGEETETAAEGEDSITRCICDLEHDDGYMVCCDKCSVWQHVACVFPDVRVGTPLPEEYLCDACHPRKLDRNRARALQLQRRKQLFNNSESSDSSSSSLEIASRTSTSNKKHGAVARRRAEAIPRKSIKLGKLDPCESVLKNTVKSRRKDSTMKSASQVGKRTKLRKKMEAKLPKGTVRRKTKNKETTKHDKDAGVHKDRSEKGDRADDYNQLSPELKSKLQIMKSSGIRDLNMKHSRARCRIGHLPQGEAILLATCNMSKGQLIVEIRGKFLFSEELPVKADCLFFYRFPKDDSEIVIDATGEDNLVRSARRSCRPNTEMKHCIVKGSLRMYLIATEDLNKNQEITIGHDTISDNVTQKEGCLCRNRECPFAGQKHSQMASYAERRRRGRRRTVSDESEGSPVKNKKENASKSQTDSNRKNSVQSNRSPCSPCQPELRVDKDRKLTRDERKIEQAMKIFAQMERDTARKKDKDRPHLSMISSRKETHVGSKADSDKESTMESNKSKKRRRRRKRRSRKVRLPSGASAISVTQFNSGDSDLSSADELPSPRGKNVLKNSRDSGLLSPTDRNLSPRGDKRRDSSSSRDRDKRNDAAGLLLALGGRYLPGQKTPTREKESENEGSPPTPLSSACLLVAAAVGPLAPGFRFPKTKKGLMNEWLNKSPEHSNQEFSPRAELAPPNPKAESSLPPGAPKLSNLSNRLFSFPVADDKSMDMKVDPVKDTRIIIDGRTSSGTPAGFGKKRWLRQAISEECDAPQGQGSPPCPPDNVTPLKKRRLARESLSSDPPTTPPMSQIVSQSKDEPTFTGGDVNSPESPVVMDTDNEVTLSERVDSLRREYMESEQRNLLKEYDYMMENQQRNDKESHDKFNSYNCAQKSPENLTVSYPEAPYYRESNQTNEKPLDLTGEKEEVDDNSAESDNDKVDSSLKYSLKNKNNKLTGGNIENEVCTSPRSQKGVEERKSGESNVEGENKEKDGSKSDVVSNIIDEPRIRNVDPRIRHSQNESIRFDPEVKVKNEFNKPDFTYPDDKNKTFGSNPGTSNSIFMNHGGTFNRSSVVNIKQEIDLEEDRTARSDNFPKFDFFTSHKEENELKDSNDRVLRNGYATVKCEDSVKNDGSGIGGKCTNNGENLFKNEKVLVYSGESQKESKTEGVENGSFSAEKVVPTKRKLSITEYLRRKKGNADSTNQTQSVAQTPEDEVAASTPPDVASPQVSPSSDEDGPHIPLPPPMLPPVFLELDKSTEKPVPVVRFKPEPTELERQRECLTERLRREFGLLISDDDQKQAKSDSDDISPPLPPSCSYSEYHDSTDFLDTVEKRSLYHPPSEPLPQSDIYPVGSSNPPNPSCIYSSPPYPPLPPPMKHDEKRKEKKIKKFKQ